MSEQEEYSPIHYKGRFLLVSYHPDSACFVVSDFASYFNKAVKTDQDLGLLLREYALNPEDVTERETNRRPWVPVEDPEAKRRREASEIASHPVTRAPSKPKPHSGPALALADLFPEGEGLS